MNAFDLKMVTTVFNPERYKSKYRLYKEFEKRCLDAGVDLYTVEVAFGRRPHEVTNSGNPNHIQLRTSSQIWLKEAALNVGISRLPASWQYLSWADADCQWANPEFATETLHELQHFSVVQMFKTLIDLGPDHSAAPPFYAGNPVSFGFCKAEGIQVRKIGEYGDLAAGAQFYRHSGMAWAARREAFDALGGLIDVGIIGGSDYVMALALTGSDKFPAWAEMNSQGRLVREWKARADKYIAGNVGYTPGVLLHHFHGRKVNRQYKDRCQILVDENFDAELDLKRDSQMLWQLTDRSTRLRDAIRNYMRSRNEDDLSVV